MSRPKKPRVRKWLRAVLLLAIVAAVAGCQTLGYYGQAIKGQYQIFAHQKAVDKLHRRSRYPRPGSGNNWSLLQKFRAFAASELKLPVNDHYRKYADVHRPYVVWKSGGAGVFDAAEDLVVSDRRQPRVSRIFFRKRRDTIMRDDLRRRDTTFTSAAWRPTRRWAGSRIRC